MALELAKKQAQDSKTGLTKAVIINADSAQVYQDLQMLSARPTTEEMEGIDHQLYGYIDGAESCSAARWAEDVKKVIADAHAADHLPILVGGTGLYVRTLLDGIAPIPEIDPEIRKMVRSLEDLEAYEFLLREDAIAAARLNPNDKSRTKRALEVVRSTGQTLDHWQKHKSGGIGEDITLNAMVLLPPREWLYERCDRRFHIMMENGALDEVAALVSRDLPDDCPVMRAIGVPDLRAFLTNEITKETAIERAQTATRQYAKRQYTWFRNQSPTSWRRIETIVNNENINDFVT